MATLLSTQTQKNQVNSVPTTAAYQSISKRTAKCYQADQQVKYLHLQAEIDVLLQQLQTMKQNKQIVAKMTEKDARVSTV